MSQCLVKAVYRISQLASPGRAKPSLTSGNSSTYTSSQVKLLQGVGPNVPESRPVEAGVRPISPTLHQGSGYLVGDSPSVSRIWCFLYLPKKPQLHRSSLRQRAAQRLCCRKTSSVHDNDRWSMATPSWCKTSRARYRRLGARCLAPSLEVSPGRRDGCAKVRRYCRKARGSGRCRKEGLILSLLRATAEMTVTRGLAPSPASSLLLATAGGCPTLGNGRALECGCCPVEGRQDQGSVQYCRAVLTTARIGNPRRCRYDPTCSTVGLRLRTLWAREKKRETTSPVSDSMRRRLAGEAKSFSFGTEPEPRLRDRTSFGGSRRGACEAR